LLLIFTAFDIFESRRSLIIFLLFNILDKQSNFAKVIDAECLVWSSGESELDVSDVERNMTSASTAADDDLHIDIDENYSNIRYDSSFYPSVKNFKDSSGIRNTIVIPSDTPLDYFEIISIRSF